MTVSTSISTLTGVQWTDLDGTGLNNTQTTTQQTYVSSLNTISGTLTTKLNTLDVNGSYSYNEIWPTPNTSAMRIGNTNDYAGYTSYAEAQNALAAAGITWGAASFYNAQTGAISWVYVAANRWGPQYSTLPGNWTRESLRNSGIPDASILTTNQQTWINRLSVGTPTFAQIATPLGLTINANTRLSVSAWREIAHKLKAASYLEASKLTTANGGGIKTYGGKWYANGQEVTYLDIIFAVRVNQLFVINNTITDQLTQVQKTNKLIKAANATSSVFSANSPTNSSGSVNLLGTDGIWAELFITGVTNGTITAARSSQSDAEALIRNIGDWNGAVLFTDTSGALKLCTYWNGQTAIQDYAHFASGGATGLAAYGLNITANYSKMVGMFSSSSDKVFTSQGGTGCYKFNSSTLSQTDCTTITTELKSYTSNLESDNQTAQTQLDQYSNKRTETLDDISTIVKGSTNVLSSIGKNFGALS